MLIQLYGFHPLKKEKENPRCIGQIEENWMIKSKIEQSDERRGHHHHQRCPNTARHQQHSAANTSQKQKFREEKL